jgi:hypothetical protein
MVDIDYSTEKHLQRKADPILINLFRYREYEMNIAGLKNQFIKLHQDVAVPTPRKITVFRE